MWIFGKHRHIDTATLSEFLDGRLAGRGRDRIERAMAACAQCREELDSLRATAALLRELPELTPPRSFVLPAAPVAGPAVAARPPLFSGFLPRRAPGWAYAGAASLAGLALLVGVLAGLGQLPGQPGAGESIGTELAAMATSTEMEMPEPAMFAASEAQSAPAAAASVPQPTVMPAGADPAMPAAADVSRERATPAAREEPAAAQAIVAKEITAEKGLQEATDTESTSHVVDAELIPEPASEPAPIPAAVAAEPIPTPAPAVTAAPLATSATLQATPALIPAEATTEDSAPPPAPAATPPGEATGYADLPLPTTTASPDAPEQAGQASASPDPPHLAVAASSDTSGAGQTAPRPAATATLEPTATANPTATPAPTPVSTTPPQPTATQAPTPTSTATPQPTVTARPAPTVHPPTAVVRAPTGPRTDGGPSRAQGPQGPAGLTGWSGPIPGKDHEAPELWILLAGAAALAALTIALVWLFRRLRRIR